MAPDAAAAALARHLELIDSAVAAHGGLPAGGTSESDGVLAVFGSTAEAVAAALAVQQAFAAEAWPMGPTIRVRIGVYTGEVRGRDGRDDTGLATVRCARLRDVANGGQTLLSSATASLAADALPEGSWLVDLGYAGCETCLGQSVCSSCVIATCPTGSHRCARWTCCPTTCRSS